MDLEIQEKELSKKPMKVVGTYINQDIYQILQDESKENFITISSLLKKIIYQYIDNRQKRSV